MEASNNSLKNYPRARKQTAYLPAGWEMLTSRSREKTIGESLESLGTRFEKTSDTPGLDAQVLLAHLLDKPRSWVLAHPQESLTGGRSAALEKLAARVENGEPLPYILGRWEFFGLDFDVSPGVLIPRPETELLVEHALARLKKLEPARGEVSVLDIGTGSGCIAIALAVNEPRIKITASDISPAALEVARGNTGKLKVTDRINFLEADLFNAPPLRGSFSVIVSNPPYIPTRKLRHTGVYGKEPTQALDGGSDGLVLIRRILKEAPIHLPPGGLVLVEIESSEGSQVLSLASESFPKARIRLHKDLAGHDRLLEVQA
jgi:release factor glutamine methyltransferase